MAELITIERLGLTFIANGLAANNKISFQGSDIQFSSEITPNYTETFVYGRNDPVITYKNTTRSIKFSFRVSNGNSSLNADMNILTQMLYPVYDQNNVIVGSPLFRVKFSNLLCDPTDPNKGLICSLSNVVIGEDFKYGRIALGDGADGAGAGGVGATTVGTVESGAAFKRFKAAMTIRPLHQNPVGFDVKGGWKGGGGNGQTFPFGEYKG